MIKFLRNSLTPHTPLLIVFLQVHTMKHFYQTAHILYQVSSTNNNNKNNYLIPQFKFR